MAMAVSWRRRTTKSSCLVGLSALASSLTISCIIRATMQLTTVRVSSLRLAGIP